MKSFDPPPSTRPVSALEGRGPSSAPSSSSRSAAAPSSGSERPSRFGMARQLGLFSAIGVLAATLLMVCTNVLASRFYKRWDVTSAGLYTLSAPTIETLRGLSENVDVIVFLSQSDPDFGGLERLLDQYRAESRLVNVRYVDPDRNPAEFIALQSRYRLSEGRAEGGHVVSDAAVVVTRGEARWVIGAEDISALDEEQGRVESRVEQAVTEGLRQVLDPTPVEVCFSTGFGEPEIEDTGPTGLAALDYTLRRNNYTTRGLDLGSASSELGLSRCDLIVLAAPRDSVSPAVVEKLVLAARRGKAILASIGPSLDDRERPRPSGLEPLLAAFGLRAEPGLIFERDPNAVLPVGLGGEAFLASPAPHAITEGLIHEGQARYRVLLQLAQGLERLQPDVAPGSPASEPPATAPAGSAPGNHPSGGSPSDPAPAANPPSGDAPGRIARLLTTSERAFAVLDVSRLAEGAVDLESLEHDGQGPFDVAFAAELGPSSKDKRAGRLLVIGSQSPLLGATWQDASLTGTRRFVESAVAWLVSRPSLVSVPEKSGRQIELRFTEESLAEVVRYVLVYMPGTALALGALILLRRRSGSASRVSLPGAADHGRSGGKGSGREGGVP